MHGIYSATCQTCKNKIGHSRARILIPRHFCKETLSCLIAKALRISRNPYVLLRNSQSILLKKDELGTPYSLFPASKP
jgi:hypothetical protein